ncbi:efflux RND transporter permease subunit [Cytophaga hutchinsonii]|uniref:Multidrug efflux membrane fusion protein n=1 Tax=Cytophaga hutchinsonii (strain ATCC 33406 / DSM 1761 / CIP 103989 / NBRC 15051 / NCIMB 9469 / D465) TaxID=269798 RepID=A0A6N4SU58_CYTH3|nr:efflux RND transporter permease subunit [Cytophaga hutchinsonii]ABG59910.1 multidrug efflux membrane fusion protein [Cytophaga hutchinsonii ATCC 33406]SFX27564.1 hydrophobic/amphiphilic exporter-1, HAE1 family [Cytophaga hutchinsonii ATCC 33406]
MSISSLSIKRPVFTIVINLLLIVFGIIGYTFLGIREYPSIDPATISVRTNYSGANADIIESQITEPLEKAINAIDGIKSINSTSNQGSSNITIEFNLDKNLEEAANDVRDKVSQATRSLPLDIDAPPVVSKADADSEPIVILTVRSNSRDVLQLSDYAENSIAQRLQTIPGVSSVQIYGQKKYAMRLWIDPMKLSSYGLTVAEVKTALNKENVQLPSGKITGANTELSVNTLGNLATEEQFQNLIIRTQGNKIIRFSDIGKVQLGPENLETQMTESGTPMVGLAITPQPGTNYIEIANSFYEQLAKIKQELPSDLELNVAVDNTLFIKQSVTEVAETILISLVLVIIIIYLFFRDWGVAFRPLIDIPVSLIATFFIMYLCGFSVNVLTLLAIVLATGLVVDDGIVVTENIYKKVEEGMSPIEAAIKGSNEILIPVISISITLAAVFLPVIFLQGFVGQLFREFGIVIASAVLISAFVSLTLTPMLNAYLMKGGVHKKSRFYEWTEPFFVKMNAMYADALGVFMKRKWISYPIIFGCIGLIVLFYSLLKKETAPYDDRSYLRVQINTPEGASYDYTNRFMQEMTKLVNDSIPEKYINLVITSPGFGSSSVNSGRMIMSLIQPNERHRSQKQIANKLTQLTKKYSEARAMVTEQPTIAVNKKGGLPVQYNIKALNFDKLKEKVPEFMNAAANDPTFSTTDVNLKFNKPELNVTIDRDKAQSLGVSVLDVAQTLQLSLSGQRFSYFYMNGKQYQVIAQFDKTDRDAPIDLTSIFVKNNSGQLIQLDNVITINERSSPPQLYHTDRYLSATVSAGLAPGKSIGDGIEAMDRIAEEVLDESFSTSLTGESRDFVESSSNTLFAFSLAILLIYLILSAQFESFLDPFIIILTVPMAVGGALFSLWLFGQTWNIFSQIGTIMLIGLVTKNGILIVEFANQLKEQGKSKAEAILEASEARLRPILMTSLAIALGALPIALALGAAAKSRIGMGVVIVGGTLFALVLTLFVIPAFYAMWSKEHKHNTALEEAHKAEKSI